MKDTQNDIEQDETLRANEDNIESIATPKEIASILTEKKKKKEHNFIPLPKEEDEVEEKQQLHTKHPQKQPVIDHRLLKGKLGVYNWLAKTPTPSSISDIVEVQFKNTRKVLFYNPSKLELQEGDIVAVEAAVGHDVGVVSLTGELVKEQIRVKRIDLERFPLKNIYRKAKQNDIEKWQIAIAREHETMIRSRKIAIDLYLNMKIGDVEFQGDNTKAIFYYIADDRVDFRELIKVLADTFRIRIEMKQIGSRQEAGRIGGIGPCGRALCCSTFISSFVSVSTSAARYQDISLNPQKLAGQCGKLKCCLNFEVNAYVDAQKDFPPSNITLNVGDGILYHQKSDIFGKTMTYSYDKEGRGSFITIPIKRVKEIIAQNKKGTIPAKAIETEIDAEKEISYTDGIGEDSLHRFDNKRRKSKGRKPNRGDNPRNTERNHERRNRSDEHHSERSNNRKNIDKGTNTHSDDTADKNKEKHRNNKNFNNKHRNNPRNSNANNNSNKQ